MSSLLASLGTALILTVLISAYFGLFKGYTYKLKAIFLPVGSIYDRLVRGKEARLSAVYQLVSLVPVTLLFVFLIKDLVRFFPIDLILKICLPSLPLTIFFVSIFTIHLTRIGKNKGEIEKRPIF